MVSDGRCTAAKVAVKLMDLESQHATLVFFDLGESAARVALLAE